MSHSHDRNIDLPLAVENYNRESSKALGRYEEAQDYAARHPEKFKDAPLITPEQHAMRVEFQKHFAKALEALSQHGDGGLEYAIAQAGHLAAYGLATKHPDNFCPGCYFNLMNLFGQTFLKTYTHITGIELKIEMIDETSDDDEEEVETNHKLH